MIFNQKMSSLYDKYQIELNKFKNKYSDEKKRYEEAISDENIINQLLLSKKDYCNLPEFINEILLKDFNFVKQSIDYVKNLVENKYKSGKTIQQIILILGQKSVTLELFDNYNEILNWLIDENFIQDIIENSDINLINLSHIPDPSLQIENYIPRINQKDAFDQLAENGLQTGIHCQATGCGKTFIILHYIDYCKKKFKNNCKIIFFTERVNILADLFDFNKKKIGPNEDNIKYWKNKGIADLTGMEIINRVTNKKKDWISLLNKSKKPTLLVINRAFLTLEKSYQKLQGISMILHDECHNTTSKQCHDFLKFQRNKNIPIVGFSATPLRTGKDDLTRLKEIYDMECPLLTNYNMIYSIRSKLILPPEFYWYQIDEKKINNKNTISQIEYGTIMSLLSNIVIKMPNKKIIAWCGKIKMAEKWKDIFIRHHKKFAPLYNFKFFLDTSTNCNSDYDKFKNLNSGGILFCASKHREGSDIKRLDGCIFLDRVKKRGCIPFIQSIGRVLRLDPTNNDKKSGFIIDGMYKNHNYDKDFVDKIIQYYCALENILGDISEEDDEDVSKLDKYIRLREMINFTKNNQRIEINIGENKIVINLNELGWEDVIHNFDSLFQKKIKLSKEDNLIFKGNILKNIFNFNIRSDFIQEYKNISEEDKLKYNLPDIESDEYQNIFNNKSWFDILQLKHNYYPDKNLAKSKLIEQGIELENANRNWSYWCQKDKKLPPFPEYIWCNNFEKSSFNKSSNVLFL